MTIHISVAGRRMFIKNLSAVINHHGMCATAAYNIFPARELTVNTTAMYAKAITFTQILAFIFPILRKTKDNIPAPIATIKYTTTNDEYALSSEITQAGRKLHQ